MLRRSGRVSSRPGDLSTPRHQAICVSKPGISRSCYLSLGRLERTLRYVNAPSVNSVVRNSQALALVGLPLLWLPMFMLHFRTLSDFFVFHARYVPVPAADKVTGLIAA